VDDIDSPNLLFSKVKSFKDIRSTAPSSSLKPSQSLKRPRDFTEPILDHRNNRRPKMRYESIEPQFEKAQLISNNDPFVHQGVKQQQQPMTQNSSDLNPNKVQDETQGVID